MYPLRLFVFLCCCLLITGCLKAYHEDRLGEDLWEVGYTDIEFCQGASSAEACIAALKPKVTKRGAELCGERLGSEVSKCIKGQRKGLYSVICQVKCVEKGSAWTPSAGEKSLSYEVSINQLRVALNSQRVKLLLGGQGITLIRRLDDHSYLLASEQKDTCVKAVTGAGASGDITLVQADKVACQQ